MSGLQKILFRKKVASGFAAVFFSTALLTPLYGQSPAFEMPDLFSLNEKEHRLDAKEEELLSPFDAPLFDLFSSTFDTSHSFHQKRLQKTSLDRKEITLKDGTVWSVLGDGCKILKQWQEGDLLSFSTRPWFSDLLLHNELRGEAIKVQFKRIPLQAATCAFIATDPLQKEVQLSQGHSFIVASGDLSELEEWKPGDRIIAGHYVSWFSPYDTFLFNCRLSKFIRAFQPKSVT